MTYDVYAGGFHVVAANLDIDLTKSGHYDLELGAHTRGFLGKLAPWKGVFETHGWSGKSLQPEMHRSITTWRDEEEIQTYLYNKDGSFKDYSVKEHNKPLESPPRDKILTENSTDVLTGTLEVMEKLSAGGKCTGSSEVFDGKRRYRMIFKEQKRVELQASKYNVYAGPAVECTVEVEPVAGKWHEKPRGWMSIQEQGRKQGTMPTIWMAQVDEGQPAVPVKIRVKTEFGVLFMHLTSYQNGQKQLALKDN